MPLLFAHTRMCTIIVFAYAIAIHIIMIIFDIFFFGQQMSNLKSIWFCDRL